MAEKKQRMIKGIPYEIEDDHVVLHEESGDVKLPLELGKSAYSVCYAHLNRKTGRKRGGNGVHTLGNFTYTVDEEGVLLTITRKNGETIEHEMTEKEAKYPRTCATKVILNTLE